MERAKVESSQIASIGYDPKALKMDVEFKGGAVYRYDNVEEEVFQGLITADSVGKFFGRVIKIHPDKYPWTRIRGTDREEAKTAHEDDAKTVQD